MTEFRIAVELGDKIPFGSPMAADLLPSLAQAVELVTNRAWRQWQDFAQGELVGRRSGKYAESIKVRQLGPFSAEVYSDLPYAEAIERGTPAYDMKRMLGSSFKVRRTKDGRRYLIIPFRWDTPGSVVGTNHMSEEVHGWWQAGRRPSSIRSLFERPSGTGAYSIKTRRPVMVPARKYSWGDRLTKGDLAGMGISGQAARRQAGMVNFKKPGGSGGGSHSQFLTFRTMMEGSSGWVAPAREGKWPAKTTAEMIGPEAEKIFRAAAERDLLRHLGGD